MADHNKGKKIGSKYISDMQYLDAYVRLASAIVEQTCLDYKSGYLTDAQIEKFCRSQWYELLTDVDGEYMLRRLKNDRKRVKRRH